MIVPSIDIVGGRAVQLRRGKDLVLQSERDPLELAREFNRFGEVAVIDLDAAMGTGSNKELILDICKAADVRVGGGIRDVDTARTMLRAGAKSIIIGTMASPEFLRQLPAERVIVALDHIKQEVVDRGWTRSTGESISDRAERLQEYCSGFLVTFVETEGCLTGLPAEKVADLMHGLPGRITVAGGISSKEEIVEISKMGVDVQVGMALYKGIVDPVEAVIESLNFQQPLASNEDGGKTGCNVPLIPTIVQDESGQVLMMAYSSPESLRMAFQRGRGVYYSRSRKELWEKGATSGSVQELISCRPDCDRDSLLFRVRQSNNACHVGSYSCFGGATASRQFSVPLLFEVLRQRRQDHPANSYSATLFRDRRKLLKKVMEEAFEVCTFDSRQNLCWEISDLIYFASLLAVDEGLSWQEIEAELGGRMK